MLRALVMVGFYAVASFLASLVIFPHLWITGNAGPLYRVGMGIAAMGTRLAGVRVRLVGLEKFDQSQPYIFMSNHVSNLDPPVIIPKIPQRVSVLVKDSLFKVPILGYAMRKASLIPVYRQDRQAAIRSIEEASEVLRRGIGIMVFPEGTRSTTGELLPFKKGPFYLAEQSGVPIVPITVLHTASLMPKGKFTVRKGTATVIFHDPIYPAQVAGRPQLIEAVRSSILSGLESVPRE